MTPDEMRIRGMTRDELDVLVEWAARIFKEAMNSTVR